MRPNHVRLGAAFAVAVVLSVTSVVAAKGPSDRGFEDGVTTLAEVGPLATDSGQRAVLAATNLTSSARQLTMTLIDEDGTAVAQRLAKVRPGATALLGVAFDPNFVRGRIVGLPSSPVILTSLMVVDDGGHTVAHVANVTGSNTWTGPVAFAPIRTSTGDLLRIAVTNLGSSTGSFTVTLRRPDGSVVTTETIEDVAPNTSKGLAVDPTDPSGNTFRAEVTGPASSPFLASEEYFPGGTPVALTVPALDLNLLG